MSYFYLDPWISRHLCQEIPEFICMDGTVMKLKDVCNGKLDCADGTDEIKDLCYHIICPKNMYRCHYGACVPTSARCNGTPECADKSDESQCGRTKNSCDMKEFRCLSNECIPLELLCDGKTDCKDGSDESKNTCEELPCPPHSYHCRHGGCIHFDSRCDGVPDCIDGSDESEALCRSLKCSTGSCPIDGQLKCPPILSNRMSAVCQVKEGPKKGLIACNKPMPPSTIVRYECKQYYIPSSKLQQNNTQMICQADGTWNRDMLKCDPDCGKTDLPAIPLIVHGQIAEQGRWPWYAALFTLEDGKWIFWCGGSLISELVIVTAGHCVWKVPPDTMKVALGKYNSDLNTNNENAQIREIKKIIIQPSYQDQIGNYGSDIAVIILSSPVKFDSHVRPVCIDWNLHDISAHLKEYSMGHIVGMGLTEDETFSGILRKTKLPVVSNEECMRHQKRDFRKYITYTAFCAGWRNGTGVCNGDSGGGLVFPKSTNDKVWVLQGIVSVSPRKTGTSHCDLNFLTVFTKVGLYVNWLSAVLNTVHPERFKSLNDNAAISMSIFEYN
ncbi:modular serine protease-like [Chrysoperla carnea]|uniref:modular serine protease-like n=1 Tax=Chrysoperla carnea TaxID=189513 RepID=UPI001D097B90|nr:modular serine protease-like [Chrysoperla carnea]